MDECLAEIEKTGVGVSPNIWVCELTQCLATYTNTGVDAYTGVGAYPGKYSNGTVYVPQHTYRHRY